MSLSEAIENLYKAFEAYPLDPEMDACPCCVDAADKHQICTKPLRELTGDDLSNYAFKAVSTWGSEEDYRHFLPRIFELLAQNELSTDLFVVIRKLPYASWENWPENERQAVNDFLFSWWAAQNWKDTYQPQEAFLELHRLTGETQRLLDLWKIDLDSQNFAGLISMIYHELDDIKRSKREFKHFSEMTANCLSAGSGLKNHCWKQVSFISSKAIRSLRNKFQALCISWKL